MLDFPRHLCYNQSMTEHISVRTVWHDSGWGDRSSKNPCHTCEDHNSCLRASGCFMAKHADTMSATHPYAKQDIFQGTQPTEQVFPPYSLVTIPYRWMLKNQPLAQDAPINYQDSLEEDLVRALNYQTSWVTHGINQRRIFDYFYRHLEPGKSLVFPYTKHCSLTDTAGRILVGIGHVASLSPTKLYDGDNQVQPYIWERPVQHTIRKSREDGFLLPFDDLKEYLTRHPDANPDDFLVIVPFEYQLAFSYATEKVPTDAVLWVISRLQAVTKLYQDCHIGGDWTKPQEWLSNLYQEISASQPEFPGLGALFAALDFPYGLDLAAYILEESQKSGQDLWSTATEVLTHPKDHLDKNDETSAIIFGNITQTQGRTWQAFFDQHQDYVKFITRFDFTAPQIKATLGIASHPEQQAQLIKNPYRLYELTRLRDDSQQIRLQQIDYTVFSTKFPGKFAITEPDDPYRLRALLVYQLELAAAQGSLLYSQDDFLAAVQAFRPDLAFKAPNQYTLAALNDTFQPEATTVTLTERRGTDEAAESTTEKLYFKLKRFQDYDDAIVAAVNQRLATTLDFHEDWSAYLKDQPQDLQKQTIEILNNLATHRLSVLVGGAGTGKTTTIAEFCQSPQIHQNGILVLAPTGKARVVLSKKLKDAQIPADAKTVSQFLLAQKCWSPATKQYLLSNNQNSLAAYQTVIVDECSMLTEDMLGALLHVLRPAQRLILLGDPNQLPPIGAGKPFYDLVQFLQNHHPDHFNRLTHIWRQDGADRADVRLAHQFIDNSESDEALLSTILASHDHLEFVPYKDLTDLPDKVIDLITKVAGMENPDDIAHFDESLGGARAPRGDWMNFPEYGAAKAENWQIISPFKNKEIIGSRAINQLIHERYRNPATPGERHHARTIIPLGDEKILLGDKVINIENRRHTAYPSQGATNYLANGEIGIVSKTNRSFLNVVYTSQIGYFYGEPTATGGDSDPKIELAYALTAHKVQGSTYNNTIVVLYDSAEDAKSHFVNRELIYTALTRQSDKVYILYNQSPSELLKYKDSSALAERLTNLFENPTVLLRDHHKYDDNLIHIARGGLAVRSKSELVIANLLYESRTALPYFYEKPLALGKITLHPDFTLQLPDGREIYWEHLGMLSDPTYASNWAAKEALYAEHGISRENGNLITTADDPRGGLDTTKIANLIASFL